MLVSVLRGKLDDTILRRIRHVEHLAVWIVGREADDEGAAGLVNELLHSGREIRLVQGIEGPRRVGVRHTDNSLRVDRDDGVHSNCGPGVIGHSPKPLDRDLSCRHVEQNDAR
jgi:hypothetical protein